LAGLGKLPTRGIVCQMMVDGRFGSGSEVWNHRNDVYEQKYQDDYAVRSFHQINDSPTLCASKVKIEGSQLRADAVRVQRFKDIAVRVHLISDRFKDIPWARITHGVRETCQLDPLWMSELTASAMSLWMHLQISTMK
jgi:hypothetical protein